MSCHGSKNGKLIGSDGNLVRLVSLQRIVKEASAFKECAKLFIVNACRGPAPYIGAKKVNGYGFRSIVPGFLTIFSTIEGLKSHRSEKAGSM